MIKIKNIENGEIMQVWQTGIDKASGRIYCNGTPTAKYLAKYPLTATDEKIGEDTVLTLNDGWQVIKGRTPKPSSPKPVLPAVATEETIVAENAAEVLEPLTNTEAPAIDESEVIEETAVVEAPVVDTPNTDNNTEAEAPQPKPRKKAKKATSDPIVDGYVIDAEAGVSMEAIKAELLTKYGTMGADIFEAVCKVAKIQPSSVDEKDVQRICANMIKGIKPQTADYGTITINNETHNVTGKVTAKFKAICTTIAKGYPLYMYGDAGTGKSHTAKQVAETLGLDFYESQQVLFAHEMKGYGDAGGNFVPTPFFKAFTMGGLFFLDEIDASQPEALVVLNTAIANRRFDFPVVGNVEAHPNFRVIAAGNTKMTGADIEYTARSVQDASTKNRFFFTNVDYTKEIEDMLAGDDISIANFCRDLRHAKTAAQITLCVSYRSIQTLADRDMQEAWGLKDLIMGGIFKELELDEIRILYNYLENKSNKWAKAMASLFED